MGGGAKLRPRASRHAAAQVQRDSLGSSVAILAALETRHTLLDTLSDVHEIAAVRRWLYRRFSAIRLGGVSRRSILGGPD
jgi:hypothetical protein